MKRILLLIVLAAIVPGCWNDNLSGKACNVACKCKTDNQGCVCGDRKEACKCESCSCKAVEKPNTDTVPNVK
jgi:hypothetical protein